MLFRASDDKIPRGLATVVGMLPVLSLPNTLRSWRREGFIFEAVRRRHGLVPRRGRGAEDERARRWKRANAAEKTNRESFYVVFLLF